MIHNICATFLHFLGVSVYKHSVYIYTLPHVRPAVVYFFRSPSGSNPESPIQSKFKPHTYYIAWKPKKIVNPRTTSCLRHSAIAGGNNFIKCPFLPTLDRAESVNLSHISVTIHARDRPLSFQYVLAQIKKSTLWIHLHDRRGWGFSHFPRERLSSPYRSATFPRPIHAARDDFPGILASRTLPKLAKQAMRCLFEIFRDG